MIKVKIQGLDKFKGNMATLQKQLPFVMAKTLTEVGQQINGEIEQQIASRFDRPSNYFKRAMFVAPAKKNNLVVTVGLKDQVSGGTSPAKLYKEHFTAGARGRKPFEKALMAARVLPAGWRAMPGKGLKLDGNGNPNKAPVAEILAAVKRLAAGNRMQSYQGKGKRQTLIGYFVIPVGAKSHLDAGIYRRINGNQAVKAVFVFVRQADYQRRIDLPATGEQVINQQFDRLFWANVDRVMGAK